MSGQSSKRQRVENNDNDSSSSRPAWGSAGSTYQQDNTRRIKAMFRQLNDVTHTLENRFDLQTATNYQMCCQLDRDKSELLARNHELEAELSRTRGDKSELQEQCYKLHKQKCELEDELHNEKRERRTLQLDICRRARVDTATTWVKPPQVDRVPKAATAAASTAVVGL